MKPSRSSVVIALVVAALLLAALVQQFQQSRDRRLASRLLARVEALSLGFLSTGEAPRALLVQNLRDLRRAQELDPTMVGVPLALGSQYLLMGRPREAEAAYRQALAVEPRPEIYLNLGKAQLLAGDRQGARESFDRAVALDWHLQEQVPPF